LEEVKKVARENIQNNTKDVYDLLGEPLIWLKMNTFLTPSSW
jgi:hypothetical protein